MMGRRLSFEWGFAPLCRLNLLGSFLEYGHRALEALRLPLAWGHCVRPTVGFCLLNFSPSYLPTFLQTEKRRSHGLTVPRSHGKTNIWSHQ